MPENDKKDFEFIKEQVIEKKRKKIKKRLMPVVMTVCLAILFGLIAAVTFVLAEPRLDKFLHKDEETKTPAEFPTVYPTDQTPATTVTPVPKDNTEKDIEVDGDNISKVPDTVVIDQRIEADLSDFVSIYGELRKVAYNVNKSLIKVIGTTETEDVWFGTHVELTEETTGLLIHNDNVDLLALVSLDRIRKADRIRVEFSKGFSVDATIRDYETELNLAVISIPIKEIPAGYLENIEIAKLGESFTLVPGSPVLALGSPNGHVGSMEFGIISSGNTVAYITDNQLDLFNTDIDVNEKGDGIIVNTQGEVIGLITRTLKDGVSDSLNICIGISRIKPLLTDMVNNKPRIYFGVKTENMTETTRAEHDIANGIFVNETIEDSPAFEAGIQAGDIILEVEGETILDTSDFYSTLTYRKAGDKISVRLKRTAGSTEKEMTVNVKLEEKAK
jgi:S1-C subfamily serine protease